MQIHSNEKKMCHNQTQESNYRKYLMVSKL